MLQDNTESNSWAIVMKFVYIEWSGHQNVDEMDGTVEQRDMRESGEY